MPNRQSSTRDQNKIRNASDRVVVVAARKALNEYLKYSASQLLRRKRKTHQRDFEVSFICSHLLQ